MRVIQTVNDTIRLLFNPKTEVFSLGDFLLVRDADENFLAQVVEVYDDKFDQEANVAKIKLIYRIVNGNEIKPYDNYTPSRECEVAKIKQSEIEKCINLDKKTISIGKSYKTKEEMKLNTNFFDNNCIIFADKFEQTNQIFEILSPRLSKYKNVLILDFSGAVRIEGANNFAATENFRLPLAFDTIDYIQQKCLMRAKLETQVVLGDVFEEVKKFLLSNEEYYIPYQRFIKVIQNQAKQTPSVELQVLISWLKKYDRLNVFARNKKEYEGLFKSVEKNKITVLDLSNLKVEWQKEFVEYISNHIEKDTFLLARLNDNNINNDILNNFYFKKKNISFIPSFAYGYKKASYIMEFAQNYILLPAMNPKRDFTHANFQIQSLNKDAYMLFGEDTKDFIFTLELETPFKPKEKNEDKDKLFISLNFELEDMMPFELRPNNFEVRQKEPRQKRLHEEISLSDILEPKDESSNANNDGFEQAQMQENSVGEDLVNNALPQSEEIIEEQAPMAADVLSQDELDYFIEEDIQTENKPSELENSDKKPLDKPETESKPELEEITEAKEEENTEPKPKAKAEENSLPIKNNEEENSPDLKEENKQTQSENAAKEPLQQEENIEIKQESKTIEIEASKTKEDKKPALDEKDESSIAVKNETETIKEEQTSKEDKKASQMPKIKETDILGEEKIKELSEIKETKAELKEFAKIQENSYKSENDVINDNILDAIDEVNALENVEKSTSSFKETLKNEEAKDEPVIEKTKDEVSTIIKEVVDTSLTDKIKDDKTTKILDEMNSEKEKEIQSASIKADEAKQEENIDIEFEKIINDDSDETNSNQKLKINDNVSIDLEKIKQEIKTPERKLPVFDDIKNDDEPKNVLGFKEGDKITHEKYGEGTVLKVINYGQRCLLQIEFPDIGKRLLDPKIAKLKPVEEI